MPFFIPSRLIEFEYLGGENYDEEYNLLAKDYQNEIDFAFFAVNLHYSKKDYEDLTPKEKVFILKAWENKVISDSLFMRNAVLNAITNAYRKKGKKFIPLFKKKSRKINIDIAKDNLRLINKLEAKNDKRWVDLIYKSNGLKLYKAKKEGGESPRLIIR